MTEPAGMAAERESDIEILKKEIESQEKALQGFHKERGQTARDDGSEADAEVGYALKQAEIYLDDLKSELEQLYRAPPAPPASTDLWDRLRAATAAASSPPVGTSAPDLDGFVVRIRRTRTEQRSGQSFARTVGLYEAFYNRRKIDGAEGMCFERQGPGDNTASGIKYHRRVAAGKYPLFTQDGAKYKTLNYRKEGGRPLPGVELGATGARSEILFHPGSAYLWSIGCINLSKTLDGPDGNMNLNDSRTRVVAVIDAMKQQLGGAFPTRDGLPIPGAWMAIEGEPPNVRSAAQAAWLGALEQGEPAVVDVPPLAGLLPAEAFDVAAAAMNGQVLPERVNAAMLDRLAAARPDLLHTRGALGQTLWFEWATGWQASGTITDAGERMRVRSDLQQIAQRLKAGNVDIDDAQGEHTAPIASARANEHEAIRMLHAFGAALDRHDRSGETPLTAAAFVGAREAVEALLDLGADPRLKTIERAAPAAPPFGVDDDAAEPGADSCPAGSTPQECAERGRTQGRLEPAREIAYAAILALLEKR